MDKYLNSFREMISLRGLTGHTLLNYCTYIRAYLDYLSAILHKLPEDVSWNESPPPFFLEDHDLSAGTVPGLFRLERG